MSAERAIESNEAIARVQVQFAPLFFDLIPETPSKSAGRPPEISSLFAAYAPDWAYAWNLYAVLMHHQPRARDFARALRANVEPMLVSYVDKLEGDRRYRSIGRIKACSCWRGANAPTSEADRLAAVKALISEAEDYEADAIVGLDFEVDSANSVDFGGVPLRRVAATGIAVKFDEAA